MQVTEKVELLRQPASGEEPAGWLARIGGVVFPITGYAIGSGEDDDGIAHVTLDVPATVVRVGGRADTAASGVRLAEGPRRPWGMAGPDPREGIPGWKPPQVQVEEVQP